MSTTEAGFDHETYNEHAIAVANEVTDARRELFVSRGERTRDEVFPDYNRVPLGVALEWERMGYRHVSSEVQARAVVLGARLEHLGITLGTVIHDVDLHPPFDPEVIAFVRAVLLERKVVFFRDQHLSEDEQVAFGRCFGELDAFPFGQPGDNPYILQIRHGAQSPGQENGWHTDVTWMECPSLGSIAQLIEAPEVGGSTLFADSHAAYLGLPAELQAQIRDAVGINDYRNFLFGLDDDLIASVKERIAFGVHHPLARTHPETGKTALYIHAGFLRHDSLYSCTTGAPLRDSARIVKSLQAQHPRPEFQCRFEWEVGSIAFWDNRAVQHYATSDYYPDNRVLRRVTVAGDVPFFDPDTADRVDPAP